MYRFGQKFDHGLVNTKWRWKTTNKKGGKTRPNFAVMDSQSWPTFDEDLWIRLQKIEEPRAKVIKHEAEDTEHVQTVNH